MPILLSTHDVADLLGTQTWRVRRLFEDGTLPEPGRFAGKRAIAREAIPGILDELRRRGWAPPVQEIPAAPTPRSVLIAPGPSRERSR